MMTTQALESAPGSEETEPLSKSRTTPANVLFVHFGNDWIRGSEQCLLDLVKHLDRGRFTPFVLCNRDILADAVRKLGAHAIVDLSMQTAGINPEPEQVRKVRQVVLQVGAQLLHVNVMGMMSNCVPVARASNIPIVAHMHGIPNQLDRLHQWMHQATVVVGTSDASIDGFAADGMSPSRIRVIKNGVDGERIARGSATSLRDELRIPRHAFAIGVIGSLIHRKGVDIVLDAFSILRDCGADAHLIVAGDGDQRASLLEQAAILGIQGRTHFLGEQQNVGAIWRDAIDVGVTASRDEAFPLSVLEAAHFGVPMVASDIAAHIEAIEHETTGLIAPQENAGAIADALCQLLLNRDLRRNLGANARDRARRDFTVDRYVSQFENLYLELLHRSSWTYGWIGGSTWPRRYTQWAIDAVAKRIGKR